MEGPGLRAQQGSLPLSLSRSRVHLALVLVLATTELILPIVGNLWPRYVRGWDPNHKP